MDYLTSYLKTHINQNGFKTPLTAWRYCDVGQNTYFSKVADNCFLKLTEMNFLNMSQKVQNNPFAFPTFELLEIGRVVGA